MYDLNETIKEEKGMLYPTIDELTQGKFNRYQLAIGAARGARMLTNEYVKQRVVAEKTQSMQKEAGNKEGEKPISAMVDPEYRDEKAVKLSIKRLSDGEFKLVEREKLEDVTDIEEEFNKELAAELAKLQKQRESLGINKEDDLSEDADHSPEDADDYEELDPDELLEGDSDKEEDED